MKLEITYVFKEDKHSEPKTGYTYYNAKSDDLTKGIAEANKYFTKFARENGITRKATVKSITKIPTKNEQIPTIVVAAPKPPRKRKRKGT